MSHFLVKVTSRLAAGTGSRIVRKDLLQPCYSSSPWVKVAPLDMFGAMRSRRMRLVGD
jgi:hypothetical protein